MDRNSKRSDSGGGFSKGSGRPFRPSGGSSFGKKPGGFGAGPGGPKKPWEKKAPLQGWSEGGGSRPIDESRPKRPPFGGDRPRFGGGRPSFGGDKPRFGGGDRPSYGGDRPRFGGGDRPSFGGDRPRFGGGDRPSYGGDRPRFGGGDRPSYGGDRPRFGGGDRPSYGGDKPRFGGGDRPSYGGDKPRFGGGDRPSYGGDKPRFGGGDRPSFGGDKPRFGGGDRPERKPREEFAGEEKPFRPREEGRRDEEKVHAPRPSRWDASKRPRSGDDAEDPALSGVRSDVREERSAPAAEEAPRTEFYIWGIHPVKEALDRDLSFQKCWILKREGQDGEAPATGEPKSEAKVEKNERIEEIIALCKEKKIQFFFIDKSFFDKKFSDRNHQGVAAELKEGARLLDDPSEHLKARVASGAAPVVILLDQITDPQNVGALARSAAFFGADLVVLESHHAAPLSDTVHRVSSGASLLLPFWKVEKLTHAIALLKDAGFQILTAESDADVPPISSVEIKGPVAIILGSEGKGVRPHLAREADRRIRIPGAGTFDSLNVGAAGAVILHEVMRRRS